MLMAVSAPAHAQADPAPQAAPAAAQEQIIEFSADQVTYENDADVITAAGEVRMSRDGNYIAADQVIWNRKTGQVLAKGNVVMPEKAGSWARRRSRSLRRPLRHWLPRAGE